MHISATSIISLDREKIRLSFAVLFVCVPFIEPEILRFYQCGGSPLVSILNHIPPSAWLIVFPLLS